MGKRFFFTDSAGADIASAWRGPFNLTPVPRIDEYVTIKCLDNIVRTGHVTSIHWGFDILEVRIILKLV